MAEAEETRDEETQEESVSIFEGSFYTVEQRLETFKGSYWPYETGKCTPLKVHVIMYIIMYVEMYVHYFICIMLF